MDNPRAEKVAVVDEVREGLTAANAALLTEYRGLSVGELARLRRALRAAGGEYKIYKNTLVRFAVRELGLDELESLLLGPTAIAFVESDAAGVAKALRDFARTNPNLVIKGGLLGTKVLTADDAAALAELPSRDQLLAQLAGAMAAPLQTFAGFLQALPRNLAYGLQALIDERGGVPEAATPEPATPEPATPEAAEPEAAEPAAAEPATAEPAAAEPEAAEPAAAEPAAPTSDAAEPEAAEPAAAAPEAGAPSPDAAEAPVETEPAPEPQEEQ